MKQSLKQHIAFLSISYLLESVSYVHADEVAAYDSAKLFGISTTPRKTQGESAVFDLDRDGNLDIVGLSGHYMHRWPFLLSGGEKLVRISGLPISTEYTLLDRHGCTVGDFGSPLGGGLPDGRPDMDCIHGANEGKPDGRQWRNELFLQTTSHTFPISILDDPRDARVVACRWGICDPHGRGREAVALDYDRDGRMDIAVANDASVAGPDPLVGPWHGYDTPNRLFRNEGGRFRENTVTPVRREGASACVEAGDINGDGWPDLLFCTRPTFSGNNGQAGNNGNGVFTYLNITGKFRDVTSGTSYAASNAQQIELHDVDRDVRARLDLVIIEQDRISIRLNRGGDDPFKILDYQRPLTRGHDVALGDVNRDGKPDLYIVQSRQGSANVPDIMLINDGTGKGFRTLPLPNTSVGSGDVATAIPNWKGTRRAAFLVTNGRLGHPGPVQLITFAATP